MSDTPRTENEAWSEGSSFPELVTADLARKLLRELTAAKEESQEQSRLLGMSGEREADLRGEIERLRRRVEAADGLAEAAVGALAHTVDAGVYPDGPCMDKEYRDDLRTTLQAYRATEGKKSS